MCSICKQSNCPCQCPNYKPPRSYYYCSICGEGIYEGEEYVVNDLGEYRHLECFRGIRDLVKWLGHEVKVMEDTNEKFY